MPICAVLTPCSLTASFTVVSEKYHACLSNQRMLSLCSMPAPPVGVTAPLVLVERTIFHDEPHVERGGDIARRIARYRDDVREISRCKAPEFVVDLAQLRTDDRCGPDRLHGRHAPVHQSAQFFGVLSVWNRRGIGAACDAHPAAIASGAMCRRPSPR